MATKSIPFKPVRFLLSLACVGGVTGIFWALMPLVERHAANMGDGWFYYDGFAFVYHMALAAAFGLGFLLALGRWTGLGRGFWGKLPIELYALCALFPPMLYWEAADVMQATLDASFGSALAALFFADADVMTDLSLLLCTGFFFAVFFLLFEAGASLGMGLRDGFGRWLRCRSILVRSTCWALRLCSRVLRALLGTMGGWLRGLSRVDLSAPVDKTLFRLLAVNFALVTLCCCVWFFGIAGAFVYSFVLFFVLRRYFLRLQQSYLALLEAARRMARGDLRTPLEGDMGLLDPLRAELDQVRTGFARAVAEEVRSQSMKTELITNVSHDLKTPLTAIITYVDLLKDETLSDDTRREYVATLDKKSQRLKRLIEDLFEVSKAASGNVTMHLATVDLAALLRQVQCEMEDQTEASGVEFRWLLPEEKVLLPLDGQRTCRIFENLIGNILKYALPGTRAYITLEKADGAACVTLKNISAAELSFDPSRITDRFVRGDASRNTEGSGLGLAIVQSFTELQGGAFAVETDGDLFKAVVRFPLPAAAQAAQLPASAVVLE